MDIDDEDLRDLRRAMNWIRKFKIQGPGVRMTNTPDGCSVFVNQIDSSSPQRIVKTVLVNPTASTYTPAGGSPVTLARGWYKGNVWQFPTSTPTLTSQVTQAALGTAGTTDIIIVDPTEINATGTVHVDLTGTFQPLLFLAIPIGVADSAGTPLYFMVFNQGKVC